MEIEKPHGSDELKACYHEGILLISQKALDQEIIQPAGNKRPVQFLREQTNSTVFISFVF